jgi:hypothetical protein
MLSFSMTEAIRSQFKAECDTLEANIYERETKAFGC